MDNCTGAPENKKQRKSKVLKEWEYEQVFKLIALVEGEPCIWNASVDGYHNKTMRDVAWGNISDHFDRKYDQGELNAKWTNLRIQFRSYAARAKTKSCQGVAEPVKWKFYNAMSFIGRAEDRQTQETVSNLSFEIDLDNNSTDCILIATSPLPSPQQRASAVPRPPKCEMVSAATQIADSMWQAVEAMRERNQNILDPNISFANYLVSELKTMCEDKAAIVRKRVTLFFLQCLEEENNTFK